jgi:hypothetical protein
MAFMVFHVLWKIKDVIDVTNHKIAQIFMKNIIHQMLKNNKLISKAKWHHKIFKMVVMGLNDIFHSLLSRMRTEFYVPHRSILVYTLAWLNWFNNFEIEGKRYQFSMVSRLSRW